MVYKNIYGTNLTCLSDLVFVVIPSGLMHKLLIVYKLISQLVASVVTRKDAPAMKLSQAAFKQANFYFLMHK